MKNDWDESKKKNNRQIFTSKIMAAHMPIKANMYFLYFGLFVRIISLATPLKSHVINYKSIRVVICL